MIHCNRRSERLAVDNLWRPRTWEPLLRCLEVRVKATGDGTMGKGPEGRQHRPFYLVKHVPGPKHKEVFPLFKDKRLTIDALHSGAT